MTVIYLGNGQLMGLSTDTKPTTYPAGATFFETNTGAQFYYTGSAWSAIAGGGGGGETNTASNLGTGQGTYKTKSGVDLQFRSLTATSSKIALANNTNDIGLDVTEANLTVGNLAGVLGVSKGGTGASGDVGISNSDSPYTVLSTTKVIRADATSGNITINLPTAVGIAGRTYTIFRTDIISSTNIITVDGNSTETIDSNLTYLLYPGEWIEIISDGANWQITSRPQPSSLGYFFLKNSTNDKRYIAGLSYHSNSVLIVSTTAPALNTLWALPLIVAKTTKFDTISIRVSTVATSGGVARCGIYRDNGNCYPGALIFDTGSLDTTTPAAPSNRDTTITSTLQVFQPGLYWLAAEFGTAAPQIHVLPSATAIITMLGTSNTLSTGANAGLGYSVSHTFGSLPDPYTAGGTLITSSPAAGSPIPAIGLRPI